MFFQMTRTRRLLVDSLRHNAFNKIRAHFSYRERSMYKSFVRGAWALVSVSLMLVPQTSQACCFCDWFHCHTEPAPVCPPPACPAPACAVAPQQVNYVPQTCYRTEYTCVPCTSYRPVSSCDPCGGAQTVMQPVTTYVRRPVMVPYTTYRPVVTTLNYPAAAPCATCGGSQYYAAPATAGYAPAMAAPTRRLQHLRRRRGSDELRSPTHGRSRHERSGHDLLGPARRLRPAIICSGSRLRRSAVGRLCSAGKLWRSGRRRTVLPVMDRLWQPPAWRLRGVGSMVPP